MISIVIYHNPGYEARTWHYFLIYQATNIIVLLYNIFGIRRTSWVHDVGCEYWQSYCSGAYTATLMIQLVFVSISSFLVVLVTCLAQYPQQQSAEPVWTTFINRYGRVVEWDSLSHGHNEP